MQIGRHYTNSVTEATFQVHTRCHRGFHGLGQRVLHLFFWSPLSSSPRLPGTNGSFSQLFKEELAQVKEGMKHINDLAHQLAISDVHLSMENARSLEHLNSRWKVLQVEFTAGSVSSSHSCALFSPMDVEGLCGPPMLWLPSDLTVMLAHASSSFLLRTAASACEEPFRYKSFDVILMCWQKWPKKKHCLNWLFYIFKQN